jgi:hypothetical protein
MPNHKHFKNVYLEKIRSVDQQIVGSQTDVGMLVFKMMILMIIIIIIIKLSFLELLV